MTVPPRRAIILSMVSLLLASNSPRRRELLASAGIAFEAVASEIDETGRDALPPAERVVALAEDKARAVANLVGGSSQRFVLAADTLVCLPDGEGRGAETALGKPARLEEAESMIRLLSGRSHIVRTGLALLDSASGEMRRARSDSVVTFAEMSEAEIRNFLGSGEWSGAAGGYRIQGCASFYVERLEGSWTGVVGLPMRELYVILTDAGFRIPGHST